MGDAEPACGSFQKEFCSRQIKSAFKFWVENRYVQLLYQLGPSCISFLLQRTSYQKQLEDCPSLSTLSIGDAQCLEIFQRQHMNQTHEKSPKPLGKKKKKRKKNRKKVSQLYDTKIFADYSAISLNKNDKMMSPFFVWITLYKWKHIFHHHLS